MKLFFNYDRVYTDDYGGTSTKNKPISELEMVTAFRHGMRTVSETFKDYPEKMLTKLNERTGGITSKIKFRKHIMLMDIDYKDFKDEVCEKLVEQGIAHTVIESSADHFWIIADKIKSDKYELAAALEQYVVVDPNYIKFGRRSGFQLRAYPRSGIVPEIVSRYGEGSKDYRNYIKAWEEYWNKPHIKWMVQEYLINAI